MSPQPTRPPASSSSFSWANHLTLSFPAWSGEMLTNVEEIRVRSMHAERFMYSMLLLNVIWRDVSCTDKWVSGPESCNGHPGRTGRSSGMGGRPGSGSEICSVRTGTDHPQPAKEVSPIPSSGPEGSVVVVHSLEGCRVYLLLGCWSSSLV